MDVKAPRSFEIHWVRQYLVNFMGLVGIVNPTVYKTANFHRSWAWKIALIFDTDIIITDNTAISKTKHNKICTYILYKKCASAYIREYCYFKSLCMQIGTENLVAPSNLFALDNQINKVVKHWDHFHVFYLDTRVYHAFQFASLISNIDYLSCRINKPVTGIMMALSVVHHCHKVGLANR